MNDDHLTDETGSVENFAEMFDKSYKEPARLEPGQRIEAAIVKITAEWVFLEVGGKGEGHLDRKELQDAAGNLTAREGDKVRAYFLYSENGDMHFTTRIGSGPAAYSQLADAWRSGIPVEGTVGKELKGGFEITISGGARAFCPFSQMGVRRDENKENYLGRSLVFDIIECGERNVVLSRKGILERERQAVAAALKNSLKEGARLKGTITSIRNFGAFVDIGGMDGLLPVSEVAWGRTEKIEDVLSVGQRVEVAVKNLDWANGRITLSLKDILPDPWDSAAETWPPGSYHTGTVSRLAPFGAFVTLGEGVDGLIHISRLGGEKHIQRPEEVIKVGQTVEVKIEAVDLKKKKISLIPAEISREEDADAAALKSYLRRDAEETPTMGTLGEMLKRQLEKKDRGFRK